MGKNKDEIPQTDKETGDWRLETGRAKARVRKVRRER